MTDIRRTGLLSRTERALAFLVPSARAVGPELDWVRDPAIQVTYIEEGDAR